MGDNFSSEVDEILDDTLTDGDNGSIDRGVSKTQSRDEGQQGGSKGSDSEEDGSTPSTRDAKTQRDELWKQLDRPPEPENIVSHVCETIGLSESAKDEALVLIEKANDAGLPIHRTRVVWSLSAIKQASEIHGESVEWREITDYTDMNRRDLEERTEDFRDIS